MKAKLIFLLTVILSLTSCQKYEDFIEDYDYSTTYFAYQRPIRTVFSDDPYFEFCCNTIWSLKIEGNDKGGMDCAYAWLQKHSQANMIVYK